MTHMATKAAALSPTRSTKSAYEEYVNPQWVSLLNLLGLNEEYERCQGTELSTKDGRKILDFLSGYCVHNTGHNDPYIVEALKEELDRSGPAMLQSHVPAPAGELAERLCELAGGPPLVVTEEQLETFVKAIQSTVELADSSPSFWTEALSLARRAAKI